MLMEILFAVHVKCSSFCPTADVKPISIDLAYAMTGCTCLLSLCVYYDLYDHIKRAWVTYKLSLWVRCRLTDTMLANSRFDSRGLTDSTN